MKCLLQQSGKGGVESHPSRGAWIEIVIPHGVPAAVLVAPLTGCVD